MDNLYQFLIGTKNKTGIIAAILAVLAYLQTAGQLFSEAVLGWVNLACAVLLILFKAFAPSGTIEKGQAAAFYITNGFLCAIAVVDTIGGAGVLQPHVVAIATVIFNGMFAAYQTFQANKA